MNVDLKNLNPPVDGLRVELEQLVELRITDCDPGAVLSTFSTPILGKLVLDNKRRSYVLPESLPEHQHLKELQWNDVGQDPTFTRFLSLCPNVTVYADYVVGLEDDIPLEIIDAPPTILLDMRQQRNQGSRLS
ncbi:hypothetical protein FRC01_011061 [Tulasnella sp. 417]|nr:hypothetical protein FRC01_011061 [Tulasnella sp. 417]